MHDDIHPAAPSAGASAPGTSAGPQPMAVPPPPPPPPAEDAPVEAWRSWFDAIGASRALGLRCTDAQPGRIVARFTGDGFPPNPNGALFGGLVVAAADQVMGMCAYSSVPDRLPATATLQTSFLRPAFGPLTYAARVVQRGRSMLFLDATAEDRDGRLCATFTGCWVANAATPR
ncbi:MAG: PaaI family thioesterase [Solirubrobacteraceae bacterium]